MYDDEPHGHHQTIDRRSHRDGRGVGCRAGAERSAAADVPAAVSHRPVRGAVVALRRRRPRTVSRAATALPRRLPRQGMPSHRRTQPAPWWSSAAGSYPDAVAGVPLATGAARSHLAQPVRCGPPGSTRRGRSSRRPDGQGHTPRRDIRPLGRSAERAGSPATTSSGTGVPPGSTAVAIAHALGDPTTDLEVSGTNFADALTAGPAAAKAKAAILLTHGSSQDPPPPPT